MAAIAATTFGWFRDPYHEHEDRYFSEGNPTKLVRDGGLDSYDPPPDVPMPEAPVPAAPHVGQSPGAADMRRADDAERAAPYDRRAARDKAVSASLRFGSSG